MAKKENPTVDEINNRLGNRDWVLTILRVIIGAIFLSIVFISSTNKIYHSFKKQYEVEINRTNMEVWETMKKGSSEEH